MMIRTRILSFCILAVVSIHWACGQDTTQIIDSDGRIRSVEKNEKSLRFAFYNVENLFDIYDDTLTNDDEFLPTGNKGWNESRFYDKLDHIYKTLTGVGGWEPPVFVGMCEIENRYVLNMLITKTPFRKFEYQIIHRDSPDRRGIDVAAIYRADKFEAIDHKYIPVWFPFDPQTRTREILYVKGVVFKTDTVHLFVNHWPSRIGGAEASSPKREYAASLIKNMVDSIYKTDSSANIMITGDFNDEPGDKSLVKSLGAKAKIADTKPGELYNCMYPYFEKGIGTEKYQGHWGLLDQWIVSYPLLNREKGVVVDQQKAYIFEGPWLLEKDEKFLGVQPFRTYGGPKYLGGYSDHLPVYIDLIKK